MKYNPTRFKWTHSGQRTDGSPATALVYRAYIDGEAIADFPGTLNPDGSYEMLFADLGWQHTPGAVHTFELTALETATGLESAPSPAQEISWVGNPRAPEAVTVE